MNEEGDDVSGLVPSLENECFFITPIGKEGSDERKRSDGVLEFIVSRAASELDLVAVRADQIAEPGQITLQVIEHVLGARAAVADLTGLTPNVFYELAIRHTARLPTVLIAEKGCALPFDIAQMRTIFFDHTDLASADQCRKDILAQLREALQNGAVDSPIATTVDVRTMQSGSVVERNVAELVTSVEELSRMQRTIMMELDRRSMGPDAIDPEALHVATMSFHRIRDAAMKVPDPELLHAIEDAQGVFDYIGRRTSAYFPESRYSGPTRPRPSRVGSRSATSSPAATASSGGAETDVESGS